MKLAVFCGSSEGTSSEYMAAARALGVEMAAQDIELIYGGAQVGLMGAVADAVLDASGKVIGVMPRHLVEREIAHNGLTELIVVEDMHERKLKMAELADGFIAMPGGAGTLEEIAEQWTWAQLGLHQKPCAFLNVLDYYEPLRTFINLTADQGFSHVNYTDMLIYSAEPKQILARIAQYTPPPPKWQK